MLEIIPHRIETRPTTLPIRRMAVAKPPVGSKCHLILEKGTFVLEEQPGNILHLTCAHAGSGSVKVFDGIVQGPHIIGRELFRASPMAMGVWHLNAGFQHGLVIEVMGSLNDVNAMFSVVWHTRASAPSGLAFGEKQSAQVTAQHGTQVLTTKDCVLYSALITNQGSGRFTVKDGLGNALFTMPSAFTGSFVLEHVFAKGGLSVDVDFSVSPNLALSWMEVAHVGSESSASAATSASPGAAAPASTGPSADASTGSDPGPERDGSAASGPAGALGAEVSSDGGGDSGPESSGPSAGATRKRRK